MHTCAKDLERIFGLQQGNIMHGAVGLNQLGYMRPAPGFSDHRSPIRGLYHCSAGSHPGGGRCCRRCMALLAALLRRCRRCIAHGAVLGQSVACAVLCCLQLVSLLIGTPVMLKIHVVRKDVGGFFWLGGGGVWVKFARGPIWVGGFSRKGKNPFL